MSHYNTVFHELLKLVPRHEFESMVFRHQGDYRVRKMNCWNHFATLLSAQISGKDSLRDIEVGINAQSEKLYHLGMKEVRRSTLSDANNNRPCEIYEEIFEKTLGRVHQITTKHKFKFSNPLFTLDATTIDLCLEVFPWAKFRKTKGAVKLHFEKCGVVPNLVGNGLLFAALLYQIPEPIQEFFAVSFPNYSRNLIKNTIQLGLQF